MLIKGLSARLLVMEISSLFLLFGFTAALRFLVYDFYLFAWWPDLLLASNVPILQKLERCIFCQAVQCATAIAVLFNYCDRGFFSHWIYAPFAAIFCGWLILVSSGFVENQLDMADAIAARDVK